MSFDPRTDCGKAHCKVCADSKILCPSFLSTCYSGRSVIFMPQNQINTIKRILWMTVVTWYYRAPWSIHTATNIVDISFDVLLFTFSTFYFLLFTFYFLLFTFYIFTFYFWHGYRWSLQHVADVRHESGIIVSALIDFSITFYYFFPSAAVISSNSREILMRLLARLHHSIHGYSIQRGRNPDVGILLMICYSLIYI